MLDTHFLHWMVSDPAEIGRAERAVIEDPENLLFVSAISIWELRIKWQTRDRQGERKGKVDPALALAYVSANPINLVDLSGEDCGVILDPPITHRDPFDEMLLVHASRLGARLLTRDEDMRDHPLAIGV